MYTPGQKSLIENKHSGFYMVLDTVWRETLVVGKFGELSAKLPLAK